MDFRKIDGITVSDATLYKEAMEYHSDTSNKELTDEEDIKLMIQYMKGFEPDRFDVDFELPEEVLIAKFDELDTKENTIADAYDKFAAWLSGLKETPKIEPDDEDYVRPYIPNPDIPTDKFADFDKMRANDEKGVLAEDNDYIQLLEYLRQREGTSFLYPSDYNDDGTVKESAKAKEDAYIAKLKELDTAENTLDEVLEAFLKEYDVKEITGSATNGVLPDVKGEVSDVKSNASQNLDIGDNKYLVTNNGADDNKLAYEVKTNEKGEKYIEMNGNDWRIQDISGELQADIIQFIGDNNQIDTGLGNDIVHVIGKNNEVTLGNGDDKVYIQGENNFTDMWRGNDKMYAIGDKTTALGFSGDDEFYSKGDNVLINGENHSPEVGDGLYQDGVTTKHDIENTLTKPDWFPDPDKPTEKFETDVDTTIEFNGFKYEVFKKVFNKDVSEKLVWYKDEDGRTVFESNGWDIKVVQKLNTENDENYANTKVIGNSNTYWGSDDVDAIEIVGNKNQVHGDTRDDVAGNDTIKVSGGQNRIYGEGGADELTLIDVGVNSPNFFNENFKDIEVVNGTKQDTTVPDNSQWKPIDTKNPTELQLKEINAIYNAFGIDINTTPAKNIKVNENNLGLTIGNTGYVAKADTNGNITEITAKTGDKKTAQVLYKYDANNNLQSTTMKDFANNKETVTLADGSKTETVYQDITAKNPVVLSSVKYDKDGKQVDNGVIDTKTNTKTITNNDGKVVQTFTDVTATNAKPIKEEKYDTKGNLTATTNFDYENNITETVNADKTTVTSKYDNLQSTPATILYSSYKDADGNWVKTDIYQGAKNGKEINMTYQNQYMSLDDLYKAVDKNNDGEIVASEVIELYNSTDDPLLKAVLSYMTDGTDVSINFIEAASDGSRYDYEKNNNKGITFNTKELDRISENGTVTDAKLQQLATDSAWANIVGGAINNGWNYEQEYTMSKFNPAYALSDEGKFHKYTMELLDIGNDKQVSREDVAKLGIETIADYKNDELFKQIREASDLVEMLDKVTDGGQANKVISLQDMETVISNLEKAENKDGALIEKLKKLCEKYKVEGADKTKTVPAGELFKEALKVVGFPKEIK